MTVKELIKQLKEYDKNTEIRVGYTVQNEDVYIERDMIKQDIIVSNYDGKTTIIFYPLILN